MKKLTYTEQLKHPNWQRKRLEMLAQAGWACSSCDAKDVTLHVHHKQYFKGRMAWEYEDNELDVLCETCHADHHELEEILKQVLQVHPDATRLALCLLGGYLHGNYDLFGPLADAAKANGGAHFDIAVFASAMAMCSRETLAKVLTEYTGGSLPRGPIVEDLIDRWSQTSA